MRCGSAPLARRAAPSIFYRDQRGGGCICTSACGDLSLLRPLSDGFSSRVTLIPVRPTPPQPRIQPPVIKPLETRGRKERSQGRKRRNMSRDGQGRGALPPFLGGMKSGFVFLCSRTCKKYQTKPDVGLLKKPDVVFQLQAARKQTTGLHLYYFTAGIYRTERKRRMRERTGGDEEGH